MTNDIKRRMYEHENGIVAGFTKQYKVFKLVFVEKCSDVKSVIAREKQLKNWHRDWKINLIRESNPEWKDLRGDHEK